MPSVVVNLRTPALLMPWSVVVKAVAMHSRLILQYPRSNNHASAFTLVSCLCAAFSFLAEGGGINECDGKNLKYGLPKWREKPETLLSPQGIKSSTF
jgi:hypothetical protein